MRNILVEYTPASVRVASEDFTDQTGSPTRRSKTRAEDDFYPSSDNHFGHDASWEDLLGCHQAVRDALLEGVERHLLPRRPVLLDPVRKQIAAEHVAHPARGG